MKRLLVVVDYQNDFVDGALGFENAVLIEKCIADKIKTYREQGDEVAFTFDTHNRDCLSTQEGKYFPIEHCIKDTDGWKLYGEIADLIKETDMCFYKPAFGSAELFKYLQNSSYKSIEFVGVVSNICVLANVVLAKTVPEVPIIVVASCVASNDDSLNKAALDVMASMQIQVCKM